MSADERLVQHFDALRYGAIIICTRSSSMLWTEGAFYKMRGPTGTHSLARSATDEPRLAAHWNGFRANAVTEFGGRNAEPAEFAFGATQTKAIGGTL